MWQTKQFCFSLQVHKLIRSNTDSSSQQNRSRFGAPRPNRPKPTLRQSLKQVFCYQATSNLWVLCEFSSNLAWGNSTATTTFVVALGSSGSLLGCETSVQLGIVSLACSTSMKDPLISEMQIKFPSVFSGKIGKLKNFQLQLHIDHSVKPIAQKYRPVPFHQRDALEHEHNKHL